MSKKLDGGNKISFSMYINKCDMSVPIEFDLDENKRIDNYPECTSNLNISWQVIKMFEKSKYSSLYAEKNEVFFGYKSNIDGNSYIGIAVDRDTGRGKNRYIKKLSQNSYIVNGIIP